MKSIILHQANVETHDLVLFFLHPQSILDFPLGQISAQFGVSKWLPNPLFMD